MPGRKYSAGSGYRYGFNGKEKSDEIGEGFTTAEFWEYDSRIGRRWNIDPVTDETQSPYVCFSNNPLANIDPNGDSDSTYKTPGGGSVTTNDPGAKTFDGSILTVGEKKLKIQPAKGTLWSFTVRGKDVEDGAARFVAKFNTESGAFEGYGWDKDMNYTYSNFLSDSHKHLLEEAEFGGHDMWDPTITSSQGTKNAVNWGLSVLVPVPAASATNAVNKISTGSKAAANSEKAIVIGEGMGRVKNAAQSIGAKWYQAWSKNFPKNRLMTDVELKAALGRNSRWIMGKIKAGYKIYDIGQQGLQIKSPFYELERAIIEKMKYSTTPLKGF